ncbi:MULTISPECIES: fibronectin type III domain-containing protein [unclassified Rathayibacter]|uniref:fibronectin type III domain-containing protein n=1 Tax=unclassified Rathayibacter TaxID=2609250 RepID=UPI000F4D1672|nr:MULTISPECIES: fibronectin type III domain-containing protein [unclassified Rathayibacter]
MVRLAAAALAALLVVIVLPTTANAAPQRAVATVAAARADAPMRMEVGSENPLLLTQLNIGNDLAGTEGFKRNWNSGWSFAQLWASVPDDLKQNMGFVLHQGHTALADNRPEDNARWIEDNIAEADALGIPVFMLWDEGRTLISNSTRFQFLEQMYQKYPSFMGTVVSEQADTLGDLPEALRIANLYGGFHILGSLEETNGLANRLETKSYWDSIVPFKKNFIYNPKNFHENFEMSNAWAQGAWLAGVFDNWGPYFDGYPYYSCGFFGRDQTAYQNCGDRWSRSMSETTASMMLLDQWQNGATVFHMENQLDIPTTGSLYSPYFYQSILPAMRYILSHETPTKDDVIAQTKVVFSETEGNICSLKDSTAGRASNPCRPTFYSMYEKSPQLTAVQKQLWYYPRESGRYNIIPRIPKLADPALVSRFDTVLTTGTYNATMLYGDARQALFDAKYPAISEGDGYVQKSGDSWLVYNSNDRDNFNQNATLLLGGEQFSRLEMPEVTPHTWAMVDQRDAKTLAVTLDTYRTDREADLLKVPGVRDMEFNRNFVKYAYVPDPQDSQLRTTTLRFDVPTRPTLTISGYDDNQYRYSETWDPNTHQYTVIVESNGVVDLVLSTGDAEAGWTPVPPAQITGDGSATEVVFDGTSLAWKVPAGSTGTAAVTIDGAPAGIADLSRPTAYRATGLANSSHVLRIERARPSGDSFSFVPSVEHSMTTLETNDFNYGSAEDDESMIYGAEGWRLIDGKLKLTGFVFPFYGDTTVYNTNTKLKDVRYEAKVTLVQGTSGSIMVRGDEDAKSGLFFRLDPNRTAEGRNGTAGYSCSLHSGAAKGLNNWAAVATCPTSLTLERDREYSVVVTAQGSTITASIDGQQVLTYTDPSPATGWTGVRAAQTQSDAGTRLGQFVELDDVAITDLATGSSVYTSSFDNWGQAEGWMTETPLVFDWNQKEDPRSSFTFPWEWDTAHGTWDVVDTDVRTSGFSGYYTAAADPTTAFTATGGKEADWASDGDYDYWSWVKPTTGDRAGISFRASEDGDMYQARLDVATDTVTIGHLIDGTWTELGSAPSPVALERDSWQLMKVTTRGPLLTVTVGGKAALSLRDDTLTTGAVGVWVAEGGTASFDDARVVARPAAAGAPSRGTTTVVAADGIATKHITGFDGAAVKTARTVQPVLPATVIARYSDGSRGPVPVTWPSITTEQLAVATAPTKTGPARGKFTVQGTVAGTTKTVPLRVTVMPNLTTSYSITGTYDPASPTVPDQVPSTLGVFSDGTNTYTKQLYIRWNQTPATAPGSPRTQVITGSINAYPWASVNATMTVAVAASAPGAPTAVTAAAGDAEATVSWTAPSDTGGAAISGYTATATPGGASCTTTGATTCVIPGLTNDTAYTVAVTATNSAGTSLASSASETFTPRKPVASPPDAPSAVNAIARDRSAAIDWAAPTKDGGAPVTSYTVTATPGGATCSTTDARTCTITGLDNGTRYAFTVIAGNANGNSPASRASEPVTPDATAVPAQAPRTVTAAAGNGRATIAWTAPANDGGSAVERYVVTASPSGLTCTTTQLTCTVAGLENGVASTFTVRARTAVGLSETSTPVTATPTDANLALRKPVTSYYTFGGSTAANNANRAPSKMVDGSTATTGTGAATDSGYFTGGNPEGALLNYNSTTAGGDLCSWAYVDLGADYNIGSYSVMFGQNSTSGGNRMYDSPYSIQALSSAETDAATAVQRNSSPCAPRTFIKGTGNYNTAAYSVAPSADIWRTVSTGRGTLTLDAHTLSAPTTARYVRILIDEKSTAMVFGTAVFELEVRAAAGATTPEPPTSVTAAASDSAVDVSWTAPAITGGSPITGYTATATPGGRSCSTAGETTCRIDGLENGTAYTFAVTSRTTTGESTPSVSSTSVRPISAVTAPGSPTAVTARAGDSVIDVDWTAPTSDGGSPVTSYTATASPGGASCTTTTTSCRITGVSNGTGYTVTVTAANAVGRSAASAASGTATPSAPALNVTATATTRCVAGKVVLTIQAFNKEPRPVDLAIATPHGSKSFTAVASGKSATAAFSTRLASIPAGNATTTATTTVNGAPVTTVITTPYAAATCG